MGRAADEEGTYTKSSSHVVNIRKDYLYGEGVLKTDEEIGPVYMQLWRESCRKLKKLGQIWIMWANCNGVLPALSASLYSAHDRLPWS